MQQRALPAGVLLVLLAALVAVLATPPAARTVAPTGLTAAQKAAGFAWDPSVDPGTRATIERAIASAHPAAQALIAQVDGITTLRIGTPPGGALGVASNAGLDFDVLLDTAGVFRRHGQRGVNRLVLHELGHVVDGALLDDELRAQLDQGIPPGLPCPAGTSIGSCAPGAERFAESFAKWAMADVGYDLYIGYAVPAPPDLEAWAQPLLGL